LRGKNLKFRDRRRRWQRNDYKRVRKRKNNLKRKEKENCRRNGRRQAKSKWR